MEDARRRSPSRHRRRRSLSRCCCRCSSTRPRRRGSSSPASPCSLIPSTTPSTPLHRGLVLQDMGADRVGSFFVRRRQGSRWCTTSASSSPGSPTEAHLTEEDSKHGVRPYPPPHPVTEGVSDLSCHRPRPVVRRITRRRWWRRGAMPPSRPVLRQILWRRCWAGSLDGLKDGGRCRRLSLRPPLFPLFSAGDMFMNLDGSCNGK
jgi:hypothetical protein